MTYTRSIMYTKKNYAQKLCLKLCTEITTSNKELKK